MTLETLKEIINCIIFIILFFFILWCVRLVEPIERAICNSRHDTEQENF